MALIVQGEGTAHFCGFKPFPIDRAKPNAKGGFKTVTACPGQKSAVEWVTQKSG